MFSENSIIFSDEKGRRLENIVYLHLRKKYKQIYYYLENKECDFVVTERGKPKEIIQVCYELTQENLDREMRGLTDALDFLKVQEGKIVTFAQSDIFETNGKKIVVMPANDFLID